MKRLALSARSARLRLSAVATAVSLTASAMAQVGNDNPAGTAGAFNGEITTGGSYDPYTGNATRSITDLSVAGAVGAYPLAFTRTLNTRYTPGLKSPFGEAGNWRHSYQWTIDSIQYASRASNRWTVMPSSYTVNFPGGRRIQFAGSQGAAYFYGPPGVRERFIPPAGPEDGQCAVLLPDGGRVDFYVYGDREADETTNTVTTTFTFELIDIVDPYGQTTTFTQPGDGSLTITEPAGRWLKLFYTSAGAGDTVLNYIQASDGRIVQYHYTSYAVSNTTYTTLTSVTYFPGAVDSVTAYYTYQADNINANGRPLIASCQDPMFAGPMWRIAYVFAPSGNGVVSGQLQSENYLDQYGQADAAVSTLSVNPNSPNTRTEVRGDGPSRTFTYARGQIINWTDFQGHSASQSYDSNGFLSAIVDYRQHQTDLSANNLVGLPTSIQFPQTPNDTPAGTPRSQRSYNYGGSGCADPNNQDANAPYYLCYSTDDAGHATTYTRDANKRVIRIDYPDPNGSYETFTYNNFGQVLTHRLPSGGTESFTYDSRGLKTSYRDAEHQDTTAFPNPTMRYHYDSRDRVDYITDGRGNYLGDASYTTRFEYNSRGQLTKVTHPDQTTMINSYNPSGTLAWVTDERGHTTRFAYDDYKRLRSKTDARNADKRNGSLGSIADGKDGGHLARRKLPQIPGASRLRRGNRRDHLQLRRERQPPPHLRTAPAV